MPAIRFDATTMILPARALTVAELIDAEARFLHRNIVTSPNELAVASGPIELQAPMALDQDAAEEAIGELLFTRGLVIVPRDAGKGLYEVFNLDGPRSREVEQLAETRTPEEVLRRPNLRVPVTTVVPLANINANIATNSLRPVFAARGAAMPGRGLTFGTGGNNNTLIFAGLQCDVARAIAMVRQLDGPPPQPVTSDLEKRVAALEQEVASLRKELAELRARAAGK